MFYTINSYPILVTKSVFKLIFVLSNYQTCTFPLTGDGWLCIKTTDPEVYKAMAKRGLAFWLVNHSYFTLWLVFLPP